MTHSHAFNADTRPLVALDWSFNAVHTTTDGVNVARHDNVDTFLATLSQPHKILAESSFESWDPQRRLDVISRLRAAGHELYAIRPKYTARTRASIADMAKTDENDTRVIYLLATNGRHHLYRVPDLDETWIRFRTEANRQWNLARLIGRKDQLAADAAAILGPFREQSAERQLALGSTNYSKTVMAVLYFCAQQCTSRDQFERLIGLHGSGYPCLLRSEIHNHSMKHARKRGMTMSAYRRELRSAWRQLHTHLNARPEGDSPVPAVIGTDTLPANLD
jgi:hypothetical protein